MTKEKTTKAVEQTNPWTQDAKEVAKMVDFYKANYPEVYVLTCLENNHVIGVEVGGQFTDGIPLEKGRTFYNYNDLCLSIRRREDVTADNSAMYGYECICGNRTTIAAIEQGIVPTRTILMNGEQVASDTGAVSMGTPYEMAIMKQKMAQAADGSDPVKADYEKSGATERYETFKLERVK